ncbi:MAG TPA: VOC family protein [Candidatus Nitrosotalea sp.]|nr:VOC family protein [Candidatus Nitrosotalea sp.]
MLIRTEQKITPLLWFAGEGEEAVNFYVSIFKDSKIDKITPYGESGPGEPGKPMMIEFTLEGQEFMALNGGSATDSGVTDVPPRGGIALFVTCETQAELDRVWDRLAEGAEILQCGWLRDRYGFAWNIVPAGMVQYLANDDPEKRERAFKAMLQMKKLDLEGLRKAAEGN